jgi:hypothetical protein
MSGPILISSIALVISIASFGFALFQFNRTQHLKRAEKINEILHEAFELRKASQELRHLIDRTDDIDSHDEFLSMTDKFSEEMFSKTLNNPKTKITDIYKLEKGLLEIRLQFDLLEKQIHEQIRFNEERAMYEKNKKLS